MNCRDEFARLARWTSNALPIVGLLTAAVAIGAAAQTVDPYAPLRLYDGAWKVATSDGKTMRIDNHCARTGRFFVCEQAVDRTAKALVVFLPTGSRGDQLSYRTEAITIDGGGSGDAGDLVISGSRWVYGGGATKDGRPRERTVNLFSRPDHIRFDIQSSPDGVSWKTSLSGEEDRIR